MRAGVWFKSLPRIDRVLVDLTIKVVDNIRSHHLAKSVFVVVGKLEEMLEGRLSRMTRTVGVELAEKFGALAVSWGNASAKGWRCDLAFARYLAMCSLNNGGLRVSSS
jgi:hypothetical protein